MLGINSTDISARKTNPGSTHHDFDQDQKHQLLLQYQKNVLIKDPSDIFVKVSPKVGIFTSLFYPSVLQEMFRTKQNTRHPIGTLPKSQMAILPL